MSKEPKDKKGFIEVKVGNYYIRVPFDKVGQQIALILLNSVKFDEKKEAE